MEVISYYVTLLLNRELVTKAKLCLVSVFPDTIEDCAKMRNLPKIFPKRFRECGHWSLYLVWAYISWTQDPTRSDRICWPDDPVPALHHNTLTMSGVDDTVHLSSFTHILEWWTKNILFVTIFPWCCTEFPDDSPNFPCSEKSLSSKYSRFMATLYMQRSQQAPQQQQLQSTQ